MSPQSSLVLLEFNELTPALMDRFIAEGGKGPYPDME